MSAWPLIALALVAGESGRVPAAGITRVTISTTNADLHVETASVAQIEWSGGEDVDFAVEHDGHLRIHVQDGDALVVRMPPGRELSLSSQSGDVELVGRFGDVSCAVTSGDIQIRGRVKAIDVESLNGELELAGTAESIRLTSISGGVHVKGGVTELKARTTSGDLELVGELPQRVQFQTVSGDLLVKGHVRRPGGSWTLRSVSGDIHLGIDGGARVSLHSRTGTCIVKGQELEGHGVAHDIAGGGGVSIEAFTFSGDVLID